MYALSSHIIARSFLLKLVPLPKLLAPSSASIANTALIGTLSVASTARNPFKERTISSLRATLQTVLPEVSKMPGVEVKDGKLAIEGRTLLTNVGLEIVDVSSTGGKKGVFIGAVADEPSDRHVFNLGTLRGVRFTSCFRFKMWFMTQRMGDKGSHIMPETQYLLAELPMEDSDTLYAIVLPLLDGPFRASLNGTSNDEVQLICETGSPLLRDTKVPAAMYVHYGTNPFAAVREAYRVAQAELKSFTLRKDKKMPAFLDYFGWCTWDSFYTKVDPQGIERGLKSLKAANAPPGFLIIDDGWQSITRDGSPSHRASSQTAEELLAANKELDAKFLQHAEHEGVCLNGHLNNLAPKNGDEGAKATTLLQIGCFEEGATHKSMETEMNREEEADPPVGTQPLHKLFSVQENGKFRDAARGGAGSFKATIETWKSNHNLKHILVWQAMLAYWGGVMPGLYNSTVQKARFTPTILSNQIDGCYPDMAKLGCGVMDAEGVKKYWEDSCKYLASAGVDGLKVDVQNSPEVFGANLGGRRALTQAYQDALARGVSLAFPDTAILSSMSHGSDAVFLAKGPTVVRASDDFWPLDPSSHTVHLLSCAFNSLYLGEVMQPDWDMFHSDHYAAPLHAAARAISGGPVYVSDRPGEHDPKILEKLVHPDGRVTRAKSYALPTRDCIVKDPALDGKTALKLWNVNACGGVVGAFHCQGAAYDAKEKKYVTYVENPVPIEGIVSIADVEEFEAVAGEGWKGEAAVFSHFTRDLDCLDRSSKKAFRLEAKMKFEIFTVAPIHSVRTAAGQVEFAVVGLANMFNSGAAVASVDYSQTGIVKMKVVGKGELVCYSSAKPTSCLIDGQSSDFTYLEAPKKLLLRLDWEPQERLVEVRF